jgi:hypothetical protein
MGSGYTYTDNSNPQHPFEASVSSFLSNAVYRAWNDIKQMNTGSLSQTSFSYDQRLQPTSYTLTAGSSSYKWNYQYFADGTLRSASDIASDHFDKAYAYDHLGRITEAYSGREARGLAPTSPIPDSPYRQTFSYDAFNQQLRETGRIWQQQLSGQIYSYSNNRRSDLMYNAEGNVIADAQGSHFFDAAGERTAVTAGMVGGGQTGHSELPGEERSFTYDADGQPIKSISLSRVETVIGAGPQTSIAEDVETTYYLRAAALGGYVVAELNAQGQKTKQYIYAGGERLAQHATSTGLNTINWQHRNPLTDSWISFDPNQSFSFRTEVDAHGRETGLEPLTIVPNEPPPPPTRLPSYLEQSGAPTIEAELGMQLYEDFYLNQIYKGGNGPAEGGYDRLRTIREFQLRISGSFLLGQDKRLAVLFGDYDAVIGDRGWKRGGEIPVNLYYYQLKPGSRPKTGSKPSADKTGSQGSAMDIARKKNCATPNSIVENFKKEFEALWDKTMATAKPGVEGEEFGALVFYEQASNTYPIVELSPGRHVPIGSKNSPKVPALPEVGPDTNNALATFRNQNRIVEFLVFFHTHPNYTGIPTESRAGKPSPDDKDFQRNHGNPLGIIRTGNGYFFFIKGKEFGQTDARANDCITTLKRLRN